VARPDASDRAAHRRSGLSVHAVAWSPDGERLAGYLGSEIGNYVAVYSFAERRFTRVTDYGDYPVWLNDSRRLLFTKANQLHVVDTTTRTTRQVMSIPSDAVNDMDLEIALTADNGTLYFTRRSQQADIWLLTFK
jgi:Tol biopolymer transport system component